MAKSVEIMEEDLAASVMDNIQAVGLELEDEGHVGEQLVAQSLGLDDTELWGYSN